LSNKNDDKPDGNKYMNKYHDYLFIMSALVQETTDDSSSESQVGTCDNCDEEIIYAKNAYYVLEKGDNELCWCQYCFDDLWKEMRDDKWSCDDFEYYEEREEEEEEEEEEDDELDKDLIK